MILRLSTSAERAAIVIVALLLAAFLSYFSIRNARAEHLAGLETPAGLSRAAQLEPGNARNWFLLGHYWLYNLEDPDVHRAIRAYQTSLALDPRSADTWLDLAAAYESEADFTGTRDAFRSAKQAYPLSAEVAWRYGNFLLRMGEQEAAFDEIRQAVQADPRRAAEAVSRCMRVYPDLAEILDRVLPPSRDVYLGVMNSLVADNNLPDALLLWSRLAALHPQIRISDVHLLIEALQQRRESKLARQIWDQAATFAGLTQLHGPLGSLVWDGSFESGVSGEGFSWRIPPLTGGVETFLDTSEKHSGKQSLRLTFDGKHNVNFLDVCQYVVVEPSTTYRFSAWVLTRSITTDQGIRFYLGPFPSSAASPPISTSDLRGTQPWTKIELPWTSPKDVHEMQICLQRNATDNSDNRIQGTAWIDDVALTPEPPGPSKP
jgi:tetratricopeptide (TPR) repeat protein